MKVTKSKWFYVGIGVALTVGALVAIGVSESVRKKNAKKYSLNIDEDDNDTNLECPYKVPSPSDESFDSEDIDDEVSADEDFAF